MKTLHYAVLIALTLALFASAGGIATAATGPNDFPGGALYIDGQPHAIGGNAELWYRFDYTGENSAVTIKLLNGDNSGMGFKLFTPAQVASWWDTDPVGQGTPNGDDLVWVGSFNAAGTYYVCVDNSKPYDDMLRMTIAGDGVTLGGPAMIAAAKPAPQVVAPGPGANLDWFRAAAIDGQAHSIAASSSLWYRFDYGAGDHTVVTLALVNATNSGVGFNVYDAAQAAVWWDTDPAGRGTADTEPCGAEKCLSDNLTWAGSFSLSGTYYVQVENDNTYPASFTLTMK